MSVENVKKFVAEKGNDSAVSDKIKAAQASGKTPEEAIVVVAAEEGYDFTAPELKEALASEKEGELDLEELEAVAGGWCSNIAVFICGDVANIGGLV